MTHAPAGMPRSAPSRYVLLMLELAEARGVARESLLAGLDLDPQALDTPDMRVGMRLHRELCLRAMALTGDEALGIEFGLHASMTTFGMVGLAMMTQPTLAEVFAFADRYGTRLQLPAWNLRFFSENGQGVVEAIEIVHDAELHRFACEQLLVSFVSMFRETVSDRVLCELRFDFPEPPHFRRYRRRLPRTLHDSGVTQFRFPERCLSWRLRMADPIAARLAETHCARTLGALAPADDIAEHVRSLLQLEAGGYPDLPTVAARLRITERTLARRLRAAGCSFRQLLNDARRRDGIALLRNPSLSIGDVAQRLGYGAASNFCRAFHAWTGHYPAAYRDLHLDAAQRGAADA